MRFNVKEKMNSAELFEYALLKLDSHIATRTIREKIMDKGYDRAFGEKICLLMFKMCGEKKENYDKAIKDFIDFSYEFLQLQMELEKTGRYNLGTYQEALDNVYKNPKIMENRYLNGLFLSQAFWINHYKMLRFFIDNFCKGNEAAGKVMEVPVGTGIYISEFKENNKLWIAQGYDISSSSVEFSKKMIELKNSGQIDISEKDVYTIREGALYDKVICGELLEHMENPDLLLAKLKSLIPDNGKVFLTTAVWAANIDHIYLFKSVKEVREMISRHFDIDKELVLNVFSDKGPEDEKTPINYACILSKN